MNLDAESACDTTQREFEAIAQDSFLREMAELVDQLDRDQQAAILEAARVAALRNTPVPAQGRLDRHTSSRRMISQ